MASIILLFTSLITGFLLRQFKLVPNLAAKTLNQLLVYFFIPSLTLLYITETNFKFDYLVPVLSSWLVYIFSFMFFIGLSKLTNYDRKTTAALIMTGGIGSTSFVGFPLFELFYGVEGLEIGILMSMAGTILVCMTFGIATGSWFASAQPSLRTMLVKMYQFPPFIAFVFALVLNLIGYQHPSIIKEILIKISSPYSIIALMTIGMQLDFKLPKKERSPLAFGLFYKLILAPIIIFILVSSFTSANKMILEITVLGAAIGSMNLIAIIAGQMDLNPPLAAKMVGFGIPISFVTLYFIHLLIPIFKP